MIQLCPPADGDDDGHVADQHHKDGQDPGESDEVGKIHKFLLFVCNGDGVHALCVGPDDGVGLQAEHDGLGEGADDGQGPSAAIGCGAQRTCGRS